jgi:Na+-transporting NADH:ubiquinone oxidoreductase subunit NqrD
VNGIGLPLTKQDRATLLDPVIINNPIGVQVLGICSALAVTTRMDKALVMGIGVTLVTALANSRSAWCATTRRAASASSFSFRSSRRW